MKATFPAKRRSYRMYELSETQNGQHGLLIRRCV
jgi:hypothetical protein